MLPAHIPGAEALVGPPGGGGRWGRGGTGQRAAGKAAVGFANKDPGKTPFGFYGRDSVGGCLARHSSLFPALWDRRALLGRGQWHLQHLRGGSCSPISRWSTNNSRISAEQRHSWHTGGSSHPLPQCLGWAGAQRGGGTRGSTVFLCTLGGCSPLWGSLLYPQTVAHQCAKGEPLLLWGPGHLGNAAARGGGAQPTHVPSSTCSPPALSSYLPCLGFAVTLGRAPAGCAACRRGEGHRCRDSAALLAGSFFPT